VRSPLSVPIDARDRKRLGEALLTARTAVGLTQRELAEASGVPQGKISRIERGATHAPLALLAQLAAGMDYRIEVRIRASREP